MRHFHILQSYVLSCCYSPSREMVMETFFMLRHIIRDLTWRQASSFITELAFTLTHFFEEVKHPLPQGSRGCSLTLGSCQGQPGLQSKFQGSQGLLYRETLS